MGRGEGGPYDAAEALPSPRPCRSANIHARSRFSKPRSFQQDRSLAKAGRPLVQAASAPHDAQARKGRRGPRGGLAGG